MDATGAAAAGRDLFREAAYDPGDPAATARSLRAIWLQAVRPSAPGMDRNWGIDDPNFEAVGAPVPVLVAIGQEIGRIARKRVPEFLLLAELLWDKYGREGRIVAAVALGPMELADPHRVVPVLYRLAQTCVFWEDCDQLAIKAVDPVLRRDPAVWLDYFGSWVTDANKWVRRAGLTAVGRLPMKRAAYAARCVELLAPALGDPDLDVKRALSFGLRLTARGGVAPLKAFITARQHVTDADSLWVLCDLIRSMTPELLPQFVDLLPVYQAWLETADPKGRRSVEGAIHLLRQVHGSQA
jgi:3-methyladenine DNA glycosylase AlkD